MRSLSKSREGLRWQNLFLVIVESAIKARFRRRSTHVPNLTGPRLQQKRQIQHSLSHHRTLERQVIHTALLSSAEPNAYIMHSLNLYSFFPTIPLVFT